MGLGKVADFIPATEYDSKKDIVFLTPKENVDREFMTVKQGEFIVFEPKDAHLPGINSTATTQSNTVRKVVVKAKV